jgi:hypothetical protein
MPHCRNFFRSVVRGAGCSSLVLLCPAYRPKLRSSDNRCCVMAGRATDVGSSTSHNRGARVVMTAVRRGIGQGNTGKRKSHQDNMGSRSVLNFESNKSKET